MEQLRVLQWTGRDFTYVDSVGGWWQCYMTSLEVGRRDDPNREVIYQVHCYLNHKYRFSKHTNHSFLVAEVIAKTGIDEYAQNHYETVSSPGLTS
jgi:hypothetical protein